MRSYDADTVYAVEDEPTDEAGRAYASLPPVQARSLAR